LPRSFCGIFDGLSTVRTSAFKKAIHGFIGCSRNSNAIRFCRPSQTNFGSGGLPRPARQFSPARRNAPVIFVGDEVTSL
jgi:hypothetical protein